MDALYQTRLHGAAARRQRLGAAARAADWLEDGWRERTPGSGRCAGQTSLHPFEGDGLGRVRPRRPDREEFGRDGPVDRWRAAAGRDPRGGARPGLDDERSAFIQSYGATNWTRALLLIPLVGFLPRDDPRSSSTVEAIRARADALTARAPVPHRRGRDVDGLPAGEGVFLACSFWLVEVLALQGRREEARELFERLLALRNDVGLLVGGVDPRDGRLLGNFPQAFTHLALVEAALALAGHSMREAT